MDHHPESPETSGAFPGEDASSGALRILACGDGPSALIGRLLFVRDQSAAEQARAAVDDACRHFSTGRRQFIVTDVADEEPSISALVAAAANADLALLSVDARTGIGNQTRRLAYTAALLGVRHIVLLVDSADPAGFDESGFATIRDSFVEFAQKHTSAVTSIIPVVARGGDNAARHSRRSHWYKGPTLLEYLESVDQRDDVLAPADNGPETSDQIAAHLIWMADEELLPGRLYRLKSGAHTVGATVSDLKHRVDVDTFKSLAAKTLARNDIGLCNLSLAEPLAFDLFDDNRTTGSFELVDRFTDAVVAVGLIRFGLRRAANLHWQSLDIDKRARSEGLGQRPCVLWFTGLSGAGKSTVANLVEKKLHLMGFHTYLLDGDNIRHGLNRDLGFTDADRVENIRRVAETAKLFVDAGLIVLVSFISPFRLERDMARDLVARDEFLEVHVDAPLEVAETRDPKGLYKKARAGEIKNFTGIDSPYEPPLAPDIYLDTTVASADQSAEQIVARLRAGGHLGKR